MQRTLTWVVVGGVVALLIIGVVDSLRPRGSFVSQPQRPKTATGSVFEARDPVLVPRTTSVPRCTAQQVAFRVQVLNGAPVLELTHVWGSPCRTRRLPITMAFFDRNGNAVEAAANIAEAFQPTIVSPGVDMVIGFTVVRLCGMTKPRRFVAEAGPYFARASLPRAALEPCLTDLGP